MWINDIIVSTKRILHNLKEGIAKMSKNTYTVVDSVEALESRLLEIKEAQRKFATYTQEQVDKIFLAAAVAADKARIPLAKLAAEETGSEFYCIF